MQAGYKLNLPARQNGKREMRGLVHSWGERRAFNESTGRVLELVLAGTLDCTAALALNRAIVAGEQLQSSTSPTERRGLDSAS